MKLNIAGGPLLRTVVNGPGARTLLHVQGCSLHCPGCFNQWSWTTEADRLVDPEELARELLRANNLITISGGEPMDQPAELACLVRSLKQQDPACSVIMYSGYTAAQLERKVWWGAIRECLDAVVAGPYRQDQPRSGRGLVGSGNQEVLLLSSRYTMEEMRDPLSTVEAQVAPDGTIVVTGFPTPQVVEALRAEGDV